MKVKSIDILTGLTGTDKVGLNLDADSPFPEMGYPASANVECRHGFGLEWAERNFPGVHIEVMDAKTGKRTIKSATGVLVTGGAGLALPEPKPFFSEGPEEPRVPSRLRLSNEGKKRMGEAFGTHIAKHKAEAAAERFSRPVQQIPDELLPPVPVQDTEPEPKQATMGFLGKPIPHMFPIPEPPKGRDRFEHPYPPARHDEPIFPTQDNGPEIPDYSRGGDGPPSPWCKRCQTHHWNKCSR